MDAALVEAAERAINTMHENLGEPLTIDDLARSAMFSKFHFSRIFQRTTGASPGRFLSALRLQEAKRLLRTTSSTVVDIAHQVGYNSVGTFSFRFHASVGAAPITYRRVGGHAAARLTAGDPGAGATVRGRIDSAPGAVFVGLFAGPIAEGRPIRELVVHGSGSFALSQVPTGTWRLVVCGAGSDRTGMDADHLEFSAPVTVRSGVSMLLPDIALRPARLIDPPVLWMLPDLRSTVFLPAAG